MKITLKSILSDALRAKKSLTRKETWEIGESFGSCQSTIDRTFRNTGKSSILCIRLNSRWNEAKGNDYIYFYKWNGGKTKFNSDYDQNTRQSNGKTKLEEKSKVKRTTVRDRKDGLDRGTKRITKRKNEINK